MLPVRLRLAAQETLGATHSAPAQWTGRRVQCRNRGVSRVRGGRRGTGGRLRDRRNRRRRPTQGSCARCRDRCLLLLARRLRRKIRHLRVNLCGSRLEKSLETATPLTLVSNRCSRRRFMSAQALTQVDPQQFFRLPSTNATVRPAGSLLGRSTDCSKYALPLLSYDSARRSRDAACDFATHHHGQCG
jgi:hypothetical protein